MPVGFRGLRALAPTTYAITAETESIAPGGSTLPRLAGEIRQTLALIDPSHGAQGITRQLEELVQHLGPESIDLLDVGGDILARGDEPTLRTPLADALTLAACKRGGFPVRLLIAGPGLDGEVPVAGLRGVLGPQVVRLAPEHIEAVGTVVEWHPSESVAMLGATARELRGLCEILDAGIPVPLTSEGTTVREVGLDGAFNRNRLARAIATTTTLAQAEQFSRQICGFSEIDHERTAAAQFLSAPPPIFDPEVTLRRVARLEQRARARRASHTTPTALASRAGTRS